MWLAVAGLLGSPVIASAHMTGMETVIDASAICHAPGDTPAPIGSDHSKMAECGMCLCCAPIMALQAMPPVLTAPRVIVLASIQLQPAARAPPGQRGTTAFPRGPPASL
jgi:hypothetical protein